MSVKIGIIKIKEEEFSLKDESITKFDPKKLSIGFNMGFKWDSEKENFFVRLTVIYKYKTENENVELVRFTSTTGFLIKDLKDMLVVEEDNTNFKLPDNIMLTCISTAISSSRGMLAYKLAGTILADYYLPLIDPKNFLKQKNSKS